MTVNDVINILEQRSPESSAEEWDRGNVGLQVGDRDAYVSKIYLALDATPEVVSTAIDLGAEMIVTHHPMIFGGINKINSDSSLGCRILDLARRGTALFCMHTNYDVTVMAQNSAELLGLVNDEVFFVTGNDAYGRPEGIGRIGELRSEMTLKELAVRIKERFNIPSLRYYGAPDAPVRVAAISPGSGKSMISTALEKKADVLVTGDIDHHTGIDSEADGLCIIDAGHYGTEHIFVDEVYDYLTRSLATMGEAIDIIKSPDKNPFEVI